MDDETRRAEDPSAVLSALLSDPERLRQMKDLFSGASSSGENSAPPDAPAGESPAGDSGADGLSRLLSNPALLSKLPDIIALWKPLLANSASASEHFSVGASPDGGVPRPLDVSGERAMTDCREKLLLSLKPFLSPERARAVDLILRISRLGSVLRQI